MGGLPHAQPAARGVEPEPDRVLAGLLRPRRADVDGRDNVLLVYGADGAAGPDLPRTRETTLHHPAVSLQLVHQRPRRQCDGGRCEGGARAGMLALSQLAQSAGTWVPTPPPFRVRPC